MGGPTCGLSQPAEEDPEHGVGVGGGAHRGAGVGAHPLLVDDDRRRQSLKVVDVGPRQVGHEPLHKGAVGLVDHPLRLRGDGGEHQRALARAGHPVNTVRRRFGISMLMSLRLFSRAPCTRIRSWLSATCSAGDCVSVARGNAHRVSICYAGRLPRSPSASLWLYLTSFERGRPLAVPRPGPALIGPRAARATVAVGVGDGGHPAAAADAARGVLHGGARGGHLGQLRLEVLATCQ